MGEAKFFLALCSERISPMNFLKKTLYEVVAKVFNINPEKNCRNKLHKAPDSVFSVKAKGRHSVKTVPQKLRK